jgi:hypothetical protein
LHRPERVLESKPTRRGLPRQGRQHSSSRARLRSFSYAHNVKIVTLNGSVTLNGVVRSDEEKNIVEMKAAALAGKDKMTNDLKIAPAN